MRPTVFASAALLALGLPIATFAAGGGADPPKPVASTPAVPADPAFAQAKAMVDQKNYAGAIPLLQQVVQRNPRNADAYNLLGYSTRASGNANGSLQYYQQALAIDPKHLGAHEYLGEAYLMLDRPADAEQRRPGSGVAATEELLIVILSATTADLTAPTAVTRAHPVRLESAERDVPVVTTIPGRAFPVGWNRFAVPSNRESL